MSRASELEDQRIGQERIANRCDAITIAAASKDGDIILNDLARLLLTEATFISEQRRKGWQSTSREHTAAARILERWAKDLVDHNKPDRPNPHRDPLTVEQMRVHPMSTATEVVTYVDGNGNVQTMPGRVTPAPADWPTGNVTPANARTMREVIEREKDIDTKLDVAFGEPNPVPLEDPTDEILQTSAVPNQVWLDQIKEVTERGGTFIRHTDGREELLNATGELIDYRPRAPRTGPPTAELPEVASMFVDPPAPIGVHAQKRMTFTEVREHGMARQRGADHRSHSQLTSFAECGVRYALDDLDTVPAWWHVGGTAVHYACEEINRIACSNGIDAPSIAFVETLWPMCLGRAISEAALTPGAGSPNNWRAANGGKEGYDWWRVEGAAMVGRWVERLHALYADGWRIATLNSQPAIEISLPLTVLTGIERPDDIKVENILDLVLVNNAGNYLIVDLKTGASTPDSTRQLAQYAHALSRTMSNRPWSIIGAYWLARDESLLHAGITAAGPTDLRELHPWDEIEYLISTMDSAERQGLYLPNKSKSDRFGCGSCGVRGYCPVGPRNA